MRPIRAFGTPGSDSAWKMRRSSSSSTSSSIFRPPESTFSPLSSAGLCDAETMIPAANSPLAAACARQGVVTTPSWIASAPTEASPAETAATSMSPDRRVSWPITTRRPNASSR